MWNPFLTVGIKNYKKHFSTPNFNSSHLLTVTQDQILSSVITQSSP